MKISIIYILTKQILIIITMLGVLNNCSQIETQPTAFPKPSVLRLVAEPYANQDQIIYNSEFSGMLTITSEGCIGIVPNDNKDTLYFLIWPLNTIAQYQENDVIAISINKDTNFIIGQQVTITGTLFNDRYAKRHTEISRVMPPQCLGTYWLVRDVVPATQKK